MNKKLTTSLVASLLIATNLTANETLDTITVTSATKSEQSIKDVTSNIEVITSQEIEERHFTTVNEALKSLSGISIVSNGGLGNSSSVFLRGMDTSRILVLIDGVRYQDPSNTSGASFENLMISDIERIEVLKGAQSGIWGADASAGVINIITSEAKKGFSASINSEIGSFQTRKFGANISNKTDKYSAKISINRVLSDGFSSQLPYGDTLDDYEKDSYRNTTINAKTTFNITDSDFISLGMNHINSFVEYDSYNNPNGEKGSFSKTNLYSLNYNKLFANHNINIKYQLSDFNKELMNVTSGVEKYDGETKVFDIMDNIVYYDNGNLLLGTSYEENEVEYTEANSNIGVKSNNNKVIYLTNTNVFDKFVATQSLRRDDFSNFGSKLTGKFGLKYNLNEDLFLSGNYGTAYNAPNIIRILNPWGSKNDNLKPEETKGFDLTVSYKNFQLTYFDTKVENLIDWYDPTPSNWSNNDGHYRNINGKSKIKGYELSYKKDVFEDTIMSLNYTHLSAKDSDKKDLARRAKRNLNFAVDYYGFSKTHINVNGSYVGTRFNKDDKKGRQTGRYTLWNTVVNYEVNKNLSTYLKVDNITDKYYQTVDGYATAGRSAYVGLNYKF